MLTLPNPSAHVSQCVREYPSRLGALTRALSPTNRQLANRLRKEGRLLKKEKTTRGAVARILMMRKDIHDLMEGAKNVADPKLVRALLAFSQWWLARSHGLLALTTKVST